MQEEVTRKTIALAIKTAKLDGKVLQAAVDLIDLAVVLKNSAHVMQHPHDGFTHRGGTII